MESIRKGREGREKFGSAKGKKNTQSSSTNREKARNKPLMMAVQWVLTVLVWPCEADWQFQQGDEQEEGESP